MNRPLMCHVVAGYPTVKDCLSLMLGMDQLGVAAIEVQIPFSDPIADGETIMGANDVALNQGMTTLKSFDLIEQARGKGLTADLYVMSYLQKAHHFGLEKFCQRAKDCQVKGLIIPDLTIGSQEFSGIAALAAKHQLQLVPVISPGMIETRLKDLLTLKPSAVYVTSRRGITGNKYASTAELKDLVADIKKLSKTQIMVGFGIASATDVIDALKLGDIAVVGSAIINSVQIGGIDGALKFVKALVSDDEVTH